ncbi:MAG: hypothetical protein EPN23_02150 [Verrucomicrobia bacterium]|nr:MAG: hypothetical protein EPN23_02150 [Verrucomicrobiota bacterium]
MKFAGRELWLVVAAGVVLALLGTVWIVRAALTDWKTSTQTEKKVQDKLRLTKRTLSQREAVVSQLETLQRKLPRYGLDRDVTAEQMRTLDRMAQEQSFGLGQREPQMENTNGVVREVAIHSAWESDLNALTHFLYALQTQDVIFDVRRLTVSPASGAADRLKGSLVINSAYAVTEESVKTNTSRPGGTMIQTNKP